MGFGGTPEDEQYASRLLRALPGAAFVIDAVGTVLYATEQAAQVVGRKPEDVIGTSVLTFVDAQSAWAYASAVAMATDYPTVTTGPLRVSLITPGGESRGVDLWASNRLDDPDIRGIVCFLTEETTAVGLGEAIESVAGGEDLHTIVAKVVRSLQGHPVVADAAFVIQRAPDDRFVAFTATRLTDAMVTEGTDPLRQAITTGVRVLYPDLDSVPKTLRDAAHDAGYAALWIEPVLTADRPSPGALLLGRLRPGNPSPNQLNSLHQAAAIVAVAFRLAAA